VYIYGSYHKIKTGVPLFQTTLYIIHYRTGNVGTYNTLVI